MKKIIISVTNNLITDQRVEKVCNTLYKNDFDILLIGRNYPKKSTIKLNRPYKTKRIQLIFNKGILFYIEYNIRLFFILLFSKKELLLSNDLDTLLPNFLVSKIQRKKLIFDSHELFSEIPELVHRKTVKVVWLGLEKLLIPKLKNAYTVCQSIANYYLENYNTRFNVIPNFPIKKNTASKQVLNSNKKVIIYQGAVNIGRGLELMIDTMQYLDGYLLLIVGTGDIINDLKNKTTKEKLEGKVQFYGQISPSELDQLTPNAVLGISLEEDLGLNYRYALPNKIFDYIQAEVPILVSDLPEMKNIVEKHAVGEVLQIRDPQQIANQIKKMVAKNFTKQLKRAKQKLIWQQNEQELISLFAQ